MKHLYSIGLMLLCAVLAFSCKDDEVIPAERQPGVTEQTWGQTEMYNGDYGTYSFTFMAASSWTASTDAPSWCTVTPSGVAGQSTLTVTLQANTTGTSRQCTVTLVVSGHKGASFDISQQSGGGGTVAADPVNEEVDKYLLSRYLWNDEYREIERDLTIPYTNQLNNFMYNTLMGMETNTLDKKMRYDAYGQPYEQLYSYFVRSPYTRTRAEGNVGRVNHGIQKGGNINSYGFFEFTIVQFSNADYYGLAPMGTYPGSPAEEAGVGRGDIIVLVNDQYITDSNVNQILYELLYPSSGSVELVLNEETPRPIEITATSLDPTPILHREVIEQGSNRVGYLVYTSFDAGYDNDLLAAIGELKNAGITDLILDFRYNGGGHVITSNMLSSCIAGSAGDGQVWQYYRYNDERMATPQETSEETGYPYDEAANLFYEGFYGTGNYYGEDLSAYALDLDRLYVLTSANTASASEAVINSLRGIDIPVTLIGTTTNGKNVGMEGISFTAGSYLYELTPITFQGYNAKLQTVNPDGMEVDKIVEDWGPAGYVDFGASEPLVAAALEDITGVAPQAVPATRSANGDVRKADVQLPQFEPLHPTGMIKLDRQFDLTK